MTARSSLRSNLSLALQAVIIGLLLMLVLRPQDSQDSQDSQESAGPARLEEIQEELSSARYQLSDQANRLTRLLDKLSRDGITARGAAPQPGLESNGEQAQSPSELLERLTHVTEVLSRWKHDPLQREPVEKERARLEDLLRRAGNQTIEALAAFFPSIIDQLPEEAGPTWMQTRLLTHVVGQIDTDEAVEYARFVFEDPSINSGVRLKAAEVAMKKYKDQIIERLIDLLAHPDPSFSRPNQIVLYFKQNIDHRVIPALIQVAKSAESSRHLRRFSLDTLGEYDDHRVIDALKEIASDPTNVDLRGVAVNSLNKLLGKEILDFVKHLMLQLPGNDPLRNLLNSIKELWESE